MELRFKRALGRLLEAQVDLETAEFLLEKGIYSRSLFHSQQSLEKSLKACLTVKFSGEIRSHLVVGLFKKEVLDFASNLLKKEFSNVLEDALWVEKRWINTRYEELDIEKEELRIPTLIFTTEDAEKGLKTAKKVLNLSREFLEDYFNEEIPSTLTDLEKLVKK
ncbi:MAG: HEPN domain-containing protein [Candidatus Hydrothermarchaeota archaeon]